MIPDNCNRNQFIIGFCVALLIAIFIIACVSYYKDKVVIISDKEFLQINQSKTGHITP